MDASTVCVLQRVGRLVDVVRHRTGERGDHRPVDLGGDALHRRVVTW